QVKVIPRVQNAIAQELEGGTMKLVGTALADKDHLAPHRLAVFSAERVGDKPVFPDAINSQAIANDRAAAAGDPIVHNGAVQEVKVRAPTSPIATECSAVKPELAGLQSSVLGYSRLKQGQIGIIAAVEREVDYLFPAYE